MKKIIWEKYNEKEEDEEDKNPVKLLQASLIPDLQDDFNLWVAHSNFEITTDDIENLENVPGIESLDIFSRYRIRVGVGKLFNEEKIKANVAFVLNCSSNILEFLHEEVKNEVDSLTKSFEDDKNWAILVLPNGKITTYVGKDDKTFQEKISFFENVQEITSCQLLMS